MQLAHAAKMAVPSITIPFLAVHGKLDQLSQIQGSQYLHDHSGTDRRKKSLVFIDNCKHNPLLERPKICADIIEQVTNYFDSFLMAKLHLNDLHLSIRH